MEMLRSGFQAVGLGSADNDRKTGMPTSAETIERLVDRLNSSTLLEDRRDACRALKAMSRKYRVEVGVQALDCMIEILKGEDRNDEEIVGYALDTLANICCPDEFDEEIPVGEEISESTNVTALTSPHRSSTNAAIQGCHGEQFTEIYLKRESNVQCVIDVLEDYDFRVRRPAIKLLTFLLINKPRRMQAAILSSPVGVARLMDILVDSREFLRNDALLLLNRLVIGNYNLQKLVAFENAFEKTIGILKDEIQPCNNGGIIVEDCLRLMLNLLRNNSSNQTFFREGSYIQRISQFFDLELDQDEIEIGWSAQKVSNMLHMLQVIRTLVSPSNPTQVTNSCQITIQQCGLLEKLCNTLMASGIPADILTETMNALSEAIRGHQANQIFFQNVHAPSNPPRPALILLLMSMVNEKQPFALRCAVLYCFQCFLHKNPLGQKEIMQTLFPEESCAENVAVSGGFPAGVITAGQLLCGGLFSNDRLSNWFSSVALAHGLMDQEDIKTELLQVQLSTSSDNEPVTLMQQCVSVLQQSSNIQTRLGLLMLLSSWTTKCQPAVAALLSIPSVIPYLTGQIGSNEHDEMERLAQGVCAFLLGLAITHNDNSVAVGTQEKLLQLVEKRIGTEIFMDKLGEISKHEAYNKALKHPQLKCQDASELVFDNKFCAVFKLSEHAVINKLESALSQQEDNGERAVDPGILMQYKDMIREQDQRINEISRANIYLQNELSNAKQQLEETQQNVLELQDQNSLLKTTHQMNGGLITVPNGPASINSLQSSNVKCEDNSVNLNDMQLQISTLAVQLKESIEKEKRMEVDLKARDAVISELEARISSNQISESFSISNNNGDIPPEKDSALSIELEVMQQQLNTLHATIAKRDEHIEQLNSQLYTEKSHESNNHVPEAKYNDMKTAFDALQGEQDDLLIMLSDQDNKIELYKNKLRKLGHKIISDEEEEEDEKDELL